MAIILKAKSYLEALIVKTQGDNNKALDINIAKAYIHKATTISSPFIDSIADLKTKQEIDAKSYSTSILTLAMTGSKSLSEVFNYDRIYWTNSSGNIIYAMQLKEETQSEIQIDTLITLSQTLTYTP